MTEPRTIPRARSEPPWPSARAMMQLEPSATIDFTISLLDRCRSSLITIPFAGSDVHGISAIGGTKSSFVVVSRLRQFLQDSAELLDRVSVYAGHGPLCSLAFERHTNLEDLGDVLGDDLRYTGAALWLDFDRSLGCQAADRILNGSGADAHAVGDLAQVQALARNEQMSQDAFTNQMTNAIAGSLSPQSW